jgi:hypothetical protein
MKAAFYPGCRQVAQVPDLNPLFMVETAQVIRIHDSGKFRCGNCAEEGA